MADAHHQATLRSVALACQTAARGVQAGLDSKTLVGLDDGLRAAEGALRRARRQLAYLRSKLPSHSRIVRLGAKALERAEEAVSMAEPPEQGWPPPEAARAAQAALRASQLILVETDGESAWGADAKRRAG